jgi:hypothetical protein
MVKFLTFIFKIQGFSEPPSEKFFLFLHTPDSDTIRDMCINVKEKNDLRLRNQKKALRRLIGANPVKITKAGICE